ncbi:MAG: hypothetical protein ABSB81_09125 [Halobacteriota archaeon]
MNAYSSYELNIDNRYLLLYKYAFHIVDPTACGVPPLVPAATTRDIEAFIYSSDSAALETRDRRPRRKRNERSQTEAHERANRTTGGALKVAKRRVLTTG